MHSNIVLVVEEAPAAAQPVSSPQGLPGGALGWPESAC